MTFTFNTATIQTATLTFNVPNGPEIAYLQLWSQLANQEMVGNVQDPLEWWATNSQGLVMERVFTNDRYTEYKFKYAGVDGLDDLDQVFVKDIEGIYNYRLSQFASDFLWNLNANLYNLEPRLWSQEGNLIEIPLEIGVMKIKNTEPDSFPNKTTFISSNEKREGYVFLTNTSI